MELVELSWVSQTQAGPNNCCKCCRLTIECLVAITNILHYILLFFYFDFRIAAILPWMRCFAASLPLLGGEVLAVAALGAGLASKPAKPSFVGAGLALKPSKPPPAAGAGLALKPSKPSLLVSATDAPKSLNGDIFTPSGAEAVEVSVAALAPVLSLSSESV